MKNRLNLFLYRVLMVCCFSICVSSVVVAHDNVFEGIFSSFVRYLLPVLGTAGMISLIALLYHSINKFTRKALIISSVVLFGLMGVIFFIMLLNFRPVAVSDSWNLMDEAMRAVYGAENVIDPNGLHGVILTVMSITGF